MDTPLISAVPGAVVEPPIDIMPSSGATASTDPTVIKQRASKYDIALGEDSPGPAALQEALFADRENMIREQGALKESIKINDAKFALGKKLVEAAASEGRGLSTSEQKALYELTTDDIKEAALDPKTFLEKKYSQRVMDIAVSINEKNPFIEAIETDPEAAFFQKEHFEREIQKKEIYRRLEEDQRQKSQQQSWGGYIVDQAKAIVPGYLWTKWNSINKEDVEGIFPGTEKGEVIKYIHSLPPEQGFREAKRIIDELNQANPSLALEFAQGLNQYTESQEFWDNLLIAGVDATVLAPAGALGKIGSASRKAVEGATAAAGKAATLVQGTSLKGAVEGSRTVLQRSGKMLADVTQALTRPRGGMEDAMDAIGDQAQSSIYTLFKTSAPDGLDAWDKMTKMVPSIFNPGEITQNGGNFFSKGAIKELQDMMDQNKDLLVKKLFDDTILTDKMDAGMLLAAKEEVAERMKLTLPHAADAVVDVNVLPIEGSGTTARFAEVTLGAPGGQVFDTAAQAAMTAKVQYGLPGAKVFEQGSGYMVKVRTSVDETSDTYLNALKDYATRNPTPIANSIIGRALGKLRTPDDLLPKDIVEAFNTSAYGIANGKAAVEAIFRQLGELKLDKQAIKDMDDFTRFQASQKARVQPSARAQKRGDTSRTLNEFEKDFFARMGKQPTLEQAKLYFTMKQMNDLVWFGANLQQYASRSRAGYARWSIKHGELFNLDDLEAKIVNNIPWEKNTNIGIMTIKSKDGSLEDISVTGMMAARRRPATKGEQLLDAETTSKKEQIKNLIEKEGYSILQVSQIESLRLAENAKLKAILKEQPDVRFIVAKFDSGSLSNTVKPLNPDLVPYTEGFRFMYNPETNFIRQPMVRGNSYTKTMRYYGDRTLYQLNNAEDADIVLTNMEKARKLFNEAVKDMGRKATAKETDFTKFDAFIRESLPVSVGAKLKKDLWKGLKQEGEGVDPRIPFVVTKVNQSTDKVATKLDDMINKEWGTSYLLERNKDVALDGYETTTDMAATLEREGLYRLTNEGSVTNPVFKREAPDLLSARDATEEMSAKYLRSHYTDEVKLQAAQRFATEFSDVIDTPKMSLYKDPIEALLDDNVFRKGLTGDELVRVKAAKLFQERTIKFLGMKDQDARENAHYVDKLLGDIERNFAKGHLEPLSKILQDFRAGKKDPATTLRSLAFHTKLGMFNPRQLFLQPMTIASMAATVGDTEVIKKTAGALWHFGLLTDRDLNGLMPEITKKLASWGWKKEHFEEAVNLYRSSGYDAVASTHVLLSDHLDFSFSKTRTGKFLFEDGLVFFNKGESMNRKASLLGAYSEWRRDNPVGKLTESAKATILKRADLLNRNMGHQSRAYWQEGIKSIPTQFMGYTIRGMEQMFSKRLTTAEKARIIGVHSAIFGVPLSVGGAVGVLPVHDMYSEWMVSAGIDTNSNIIASIFSDGLLGYASELAAGEPTNISERFGPGGTSFFRDILVKDDPFVEVLSGPGGQTFSALALDVAPVVPWMWNVLTEGEPPRPGAVWDVVKNNISSIGSADKLFMGLMTGAYYSKRGNALLDEDKQVLQGILEATIGFDPKRIDQIYEMEFIMKQRSETQAKLTPSMRGEIRDILDSTNTADAKALLDSFKAKSIAGGFTEDQIERLISDETKGKSRREKVLSRYKNIDVDKNEFAMELLKKYQEEEAK